MNGEGVYPITVELNAALGIVTDGFFAAVNGAGILPERRWPDSFFNSTVFQIWLPGSLTTDVLPEVSVSLC